MKKLLILFIFIASGSLYAQFENRGTLIPLKGLDRIEAGGNLDMQIDFSVSKNHSLSNLNKGFTPIPTDRRFSDEEPKTIDMKEKNAGFDVYITDFEPRFLKQDREIKESYKRNQNLGSISTTSNTMTIMYRDHEYVDGDRVRIFINGEILQGNTALSGNWRGFTYKLNKGINKLEFEALNMGTSGPNTAAFQITGDAGELVARNEWNLTTGNTATLVIMKE